MHSLFIRLSLALLAALLAAGCAQNPRQSQPVALEDRAKARWDAMIGNQWDVAYAYLTPGYRDVTSLETYKSAHAISKLRLTGANVVSTDCANPDRCTVKVRINFVLPAGLPGVSNVASMQHVSETWLRIGKNWFFLPQAPAR